MAEDNLPQEGTVDAPVTDFNEAVDGLSKLLSNPEADLAEGDEDQEQAAEANEADPVEGEVEADAEDVEDSEAEAEDGSEPEIKGGRFAPDSAKVTLDDGTVTTVAELKRNTLFQRDYTKKTTELSEEKKAFEAQKSEVDQLAQSLGQFRDYAAWYAEQFLPKPPEPFKGDPRTDPLGYLEWQRQRDEYLTHQEAWQTFTQQKEAENKSKAEATQKAEAERLRNESRALANAIPTLKDPAKAQALWRSFEQGAQEFYGIPPELVNSVVDHRLILALKDALEFRRLKAKAPQVREEVSKRPAPSSKRADPTANARREQVARSEQLRQTGSFEDGVAALKSLIS